MTDQVEVTKLVQHVAIGPPADEVAVSKLVMYVVLQPGDDSGETPSRQAHVYAQQFRRA